MDEKSYKTYRLGGGQFVVWLFAAIAVLGGVFWILHQTGVLTTH